MLRCACLAVVVLRTSAACSSESSRRRRVGGGVPGLAPLGVAGSEYGVCG